MPQAEQIEPEAPARVERLLIVPMQAGAYGLFIDRVNCTMERRINVLADQVLDVVREVLSRG